MKRISSLALGVGMLFVVSSTASASLVTEILDYSLFGKTLTDLGTNVTVHSGLTGSNGPVGVGHGGETQGLAGGGTLTVGTHPDVNGDVTFNGNVTFGNGGAGSEVVGSVNSGGNIQAGKNFNVTGDAIAAGTIAHGSGWSVGGTQTAGGSPNAFVPVTLPPMSTFSAGVTDVNKGNGQSTTLSPGSYHDLHLGTNNVLNLASGDYVFDQITIGNGLDLHLNLTGGDLNLFVVGNVGIGTNTDTFLTNGTANDIYVETHGDWLIGNGTQWFGTLYAPLGDIRFGTHADITGALYAGDELHLGNGGKVDYASANHLTVEPSDPTDPAGPTMPEPTSFVLFSVAGLGAGLRQRRIVA